jgi:sodium-dependent phosphate transporter
MANSFAHGSNDISNSVGPYAAIYFVWLHSSINMEESQVPVWILAIGGVGLVLGLLTYGYKIMRILGVKVTRLTNSRGFIVEISGAIVVMLCSRFGLPISTTHCLVGAVVGIGMLEGQQGLNWRLLFRFFIGWVATLVVVALTAAAFTAQGIYSPNNSTAGRRYQIDMYLQNTSAAISGLLEGSGVPANSAASAAINASLAALPNPLLDVTNAAAVQLQALQAYRAATTWVLNATAANATG